MPGGGPAMAYTCAVRPAVPHLTRGAAAVFTCLVGDLCAVTAPCWGAEPPFHCPGTRHLFNPRNGRVRDRGAGCGAGTECLLCAHVGGRALVLPACPALVPGASPCVPVIAHTVSLPRTYMFIYVGDVVCSTPSRLPCALIPSHLGTVSAVLLPAGMSPPVPPLCGARVAGTVAQSTV